MRGRGMHTRKTWRTRALGLVASALLLSGGTGCITFARGQAPTPRGERVYDFETVEGVRLHVRDSGQGSGVTGGAESTHATLLVHGYASSLHTWDATFDALAKDGRVIAVDLLGFGLSDKVAADYSHHAHAGRLARLLDARGIKTVDVVAHSWGGSVALALALEHESRVRKVGLISAWVYEDQIPLFFRMSRMPMVGETLFALYYKEQPEARLESAFYDATTVPETLIDVVVRRMDEPGVVAAAHATARGQVFYTEERDYKNMAKPTLLIWGEDDRTSGVEVGERLEAELPHADLHVMHHAAHFAHIERSHSVNRLLRAFLRGDAAERAAAPTAPVAHDVEGF